jgi:hypothetical protein
LVFKAEHASNCRCALESWTSRRRWNFCHKKNFCLYLRNCRLLCLFNWVITIIVCWEIKALTFNSLRYHNAHQICYPKCTRIVLSKCTLIVHIIQQKYCLHNSVRAPSFRNKCVHAQFWLSIFFVEMETQNWRCHLLTCKGTKAVICRETFTEIMGLEWDHNVRQWLDAIKIWNKILIMT